jgi:DNA-binding IclR family transcriptional regulator
MTLDQDEKQKYRAPALEKGLDVLELLARRKTPLSMSQISSALDRSMSELFRMVHILQDRGYVEPAKDGEGLVLTDKLFTLGMTRAPTRSLLEVALPIMRRLSVEIGQSCHLTIPSGDQVVVVARVEAPGELGFSVRKGNRRPFVQTTSGVALYGFATPQAQAVLRDGLQATVEPQAWSAFEAEVREAQAQGYVRSQSRIVKQIVNFSAPVFAGRAVVAALTSPYVETPLAIAVEETVARLCAAAKAIGAALPPD